MYPMVFNYIKHIFPGGAKNFPGASPALRPPGSGPGTMPKNCFLNCVVNLPQ